MEWISVKDRLPEEGVQVLTYEPKDGMIVDYIVKFDADSEEPYVWARRVSKHCNKNIYWIDLPKPPKEK